MDEYLFCLLLGNWKLSHDSPVTVSGILVLCPISLTKVSGDVLLEVRGFFSLLVFLEFTNARELLEASYSVLMLRIIWDIHTSNPHNSIWECYRCSLSLLQKPQIYLPWTHTAKLKHQFKLFLMEMQLGINLIYLVLRGLLHLYLKEKKITSESISIL